jgi:hypothetical protein
MRPATRLAIVTAAALLAAAPASARTFLVVQSGADGWTLLDEQTIEAVPGTPYRRAWTVRVQRNILDGDPPQPGYVRTLSEYDCAGRQARWREFTAFSRAGATLVTRTNPSTEFTDVSQPFDVLAAYRIVCEGSAGNSVVSAESLAKVVIALMGSWDPPPAAAQIAPAPATGAKPAAAKPAAPKPKAPAKAP